MTITYKELTNERGDTYIEMTTDDGTVSFVPCDPTNSDYQRYLNPEAEQSTPSVTNEAKTK